ncbi:MAG: cysteine hydrolase [Candidatus Aenigmarchaeota archaeon]|nr:cysteine hydrolase [Candidatus Aenigmarchaeota archaeon]
MKALLVIDMLNDFVSGKNILINSRDRKALINNIKTAMEKARKNKNPVIYVNCSHTLDHPCVKLTGRHAMKGAKAAEVIEELKPAQNDYVVEKVAFDGFYKTRLERLLKKLRVKDVYLTGVQTDCCIRETAVSAGNRGFRVFIVKNCCATNKEWKKRSALDFLSKNVGKIIHKF